MPFASAADGTRLHFTDWGEPDGRPVLLVHGFGASQNMWSSQVPDLVDAGLRCVTFDRRGHGRSDVPGRGYDLDTLAADIAAVAGHLDLRGAVLAGHSLGGAEAVRYVAAAADGRIAGLVLSAPSVPMLRRAPGNPDGFSAEAIALGRQAFRDDAGAAVDVRADLAGINIPTLVIQGDADQNNPLELTGRRAAQLIPSARLIVLEG